MGVITSYGGVPSMLLSRRASGFLIGVALFQYLAWAIFAKNLAATEGRASGYYIAHTVLIVINVVLATGLAYLGWRGMKGMDEEELREYFDDRELDKLAKRR
jgi:hypothetical protein